MGLDLTGIGAVSDLVKDVIDKIFPDKTKAAEAKAALDVLQANGELQQLNQIFDLAKAQIGVNAIEAASPNVFVSGWRPFIGWVCGFAFVYAALVEPIARFVSVTFFSYAGAFPVLDSNITMQAMFALLGMGAYRTYEKYKGVSK